MQPLKGRSRGLLGPGMNGCGLVIALGIHALGPTLSWAVTEGRRYTTASEINAAQAALGITSARPQLTSLVLKGTAASGFNGVTGKLMPPHPLEIKIRLPDSYVRADHSAWGSRMAGLVGGRLPAPGKMSTGHRPWPGELNREKWILARLMLGMLAITRSAQDLQVTARPAPGSVRFTGVNGDTVVCEFDPTSKMPIRVVYNGDVQFPRALSPADLKKGVPPPEPLTRSSIEMTFENRTLVNGIRIPKIVRTAAKGVTLEILTFTEILVNPPSVDFDALVDF